MSAVEEYHEALQYSRDYDCEYPSLAADAAIAELEAEATARCKWVYDFVNGMARSAAMLIQWSTEQSEAEVERLKWMLDEFTDIVWEENLYDRDYAARTLADLARRYEQRERVGA